METRINILNKPGMLNDEDRKQPLKRTCRHFEFETCLDLSTPIKVIPLATDRTIYDSNTYSKDLASFICWWTNTVMVDLNGFQGFHSVRFELKGFNLVTD